MVPNVRCMFRALVVVAALAATVACRSETPDVVRLEPWTGPGGQGADMPYDPADGDPGIALVERGVGGERPRILLLGSSYVGSFAEAVRAAARGYGVQIADENVSGVMDFGDNVLFDWRSEWSWSIEKWQPHALLVSATFLVDSQDACLQPGATLEEYESCYRAAIDRDAVGEWKAMAEMLTSYDIPVLWVGQTSLRRYGDKIYSDGTTTTQIETLFLLDRRADELEEAALAKLLDEYDAITYVSSRSVLGDSTQAFEQADDGSWWQQRLLDGNMHLCPHGAVRLVEALMPYVVEGWDQPDGASWTTMGWTWASQYVEAPCSYRPYPAPRYVVDPVEPDLDAPGTMVLPVEQPTFTWPELCRRLDAGTVVDLFEHDDVTWTLADIDRAQPWTDPVLRAGLVDPPVDNCVVSFGVDRGGEMPDSSTTVPTETSLTIAVHDVAPDVLIDAYATEFTVVAGDGVDLLVERDNGTSADFVAGAVFTHGGRSYLLLADVPIELAWMRHPLSANPNTSPLQRPAGGFDAVAGGMASLAERIRDTTPSR